MAFVAIAVIAGLAVGYMAYADSWTAVADANAYVTLIMLILGIIVGLVSITAKEVRPFLIASIALMVAGVGGGGVWSPFLAIEALEPLYYLATAILNYIVAFAAPAAVLISIRSIWAITKEK